MLTMSVNDIAGQMFCTAVILHTSFTSSWVPAFCGVCENKHCCKLPCWECSLTVQQEVVTLFYRQPFSCNTIQYLQCICSPYPSKWILLGVDQVELMAEHSAAKFRLYWSLIVLMQLHSPTRTLLQDQYF